MGIVESTTTLRADEHLENLVMYTLVRGHPHHFNDSGHRSDLTPDSGTYCGLAANSREGREASRALAANRRANSRKRVRASCRFAWQRRERPRASAAQVC